MEEGGSMSVDEQPEAELQDARLGSQQTTRSSAYTQWGDSRADAHHAARTVAYQAAFFTPFLRTGMHLLDCGCGPGTITMGLAERVAPGNVVGIDLDESALQRAQSEAEKRGLSNVLFKSGNVYALPFPNDTFDAVFSHAVLEHLDNPIAALQEMYRVTKSGGMVGVRSPDLDGWLLSPYHLLLEQWIQLTERFRQNHGANMRRGKELRSLLRQAGFVQVHASASYDSHGTPDSIKQFVAVIAPPNYQTAEDRLVKEGLVDKDTLDEILHAWRMWADNPDAFLARSFCEAVGWKE